MRAGCRSGGSGVVRCLLTMAVLLGSMAPTSARADGAFPDSLGIHLPKDRDAEIRVFTNFGVLTSEDAGETWFYVCEEAIGSMPRMYQGGPAPRNAIYAMGLVSRLLHSEDGACTWTTSAGAATDAYVPDAFPSPTDPQRVLAIIRPPTAPSSMPRPMGLYESTDGGDTFMGPFFEVNPDEELNGVEVARTDPDTLYVTWRKMTEPYQPGLARSTDGGATWTTHDLTATVGNATVLLAAVDPDDAQRLYFRVLDAAEEKDRLAISDDGGQTVRIALSLESRMSAFLRMTDGTLIVGSRTTGAYVSTDGGVQFQALEGAPHFRALGERDGRIYAVADNLLDPFAVGVSDDRGRTWTPLLRFAEICGPKRCGNVQDACLAAWERLRLVFVIDEDPCGLFPKPELRDAGDGGDTDPTRPMDAGARPEPEVPENPAPRPSRERRASCDVVGVAPFVLAALLLALTPGRRRRR